MLGQHLKSMQIPSDALVPTSFLVKRFLFACYCHRVNNHLSERAIIGGSSRVPTDTDKDKDKGNLFAHAGLLHIYIMQGGGARSAFAEGTSD